MMPSGLDFKSAIAEAHMAFVSAIPSVRRFEILLPSFEHGQRLGKDSERADHCVKVVVFLM
jgi:hypothetical protein